MVNKHPRKSFAHKKHKKDYFHALAFVLLPQLWGTQQRKTLKVPCIRSTSGSASASPLSLQSLLAEVPHVSVA
jgi:hypothetical protein